MWCSCMGKKPFKSTTVIGKTRQRLEPKTLDDFDFTAVSFTTFSETNNNQTPWDEIPDEFKFQEATHRAFRAIHEFYELYGKTPAEFYYKKYERLPTSQHKLEFLGELIAWADEFRADYDGLLMILFSEMANNNLAIGPMMWMYEYKAGKHPAPSKHILPKNLHRDIAILIGMHTVIKLGLTPTRNDEREEPFNSAADVVAKAAVTTYFNVKRIWHASENPQSPTYRYIPYELRRSGVALHDKDINLCKPPMCYL